MLNFVEIGPSIVDILRFFKVGTAAILNFINRNILLANGVCRAATHHIAKFCQNWSI